MGHIIFAIFYLLLIFTFIQSYRYRNPYRLYMVFGKKGSGKTTLMTKIAIQDLRKGKNVYATIQIPGVRRFDVNNVGEFTFPPNSTVLIDEVGIIWDNRNYKKFKESVRDYFKFQRQYKNTVYLFSQAFDVDVKLRNLTDGMYICTCHFNFLSVARKLKRNIVIVNPDGENEARLADGIEFEPIFLSLFGAKSIRVTYIPRWVKYFKSFDPPALPSMRFVKFQEYQRGSRGKGYLRCPLASPEPPVPLRMRILIFFMPAFLAMKKIAHPQRYRPRMK